MNEIKDMTKKERAEMWQQVAAYVEQLERAVETQRAQLKRRQDRINALKARARAERTCNMVQIAPTISEGIMQCSECGVYLNEPADVNYCPMCGAKVIGEGESDEA